MQRDPVPWHWWDGAKKKQNGRREPVRGQKTNPQKGNKKGKGANVPVGSNRATTALEEGGQMRERRWKPKPGRGQQR